MAGSLTHYAFSTPRLHRHSNSERIHLFNTLDLYHRGTRLVPQAVQIKGVLSCTAHFRSASPARGLHGPKRHLVEALEFADSLVPPTLEATQGQI